MSLEDLLRELVERTIKESLERLAPRPSNVDPLQHLTTEDVADLLGFEEPTVRENMAKGKLPGEKVLGKWRVRRASLERFLKDGRAKGKEVAREVVDAAAVSLAHAMLGKKKAG